MPGSVQNILQVWSHLTLTMNPIGRCYDYPQFTDEETELWELMSSDWVTQL